MYINEYWESKDTKVNQEVDSASGIMSLLEDVLIPIKREAKYAWAFNKYKTFHYRKFLL